MECFSAEAIKNIRRCLSYDFDSGFRIGQQATLYDIQKNINQNMNDSLIDNKELCSLILRDLDDYINKCKDNNNDYRNNIIEILERTEILNEYKKKIRSDTILECIPLFRYGTYEELNKWVEDNTISKGKGINKNDKE